MFCCMGYKVLIFISLMIIILKVFLSFLSGNSHEKLYHSPKETFELTIQPTMIFHAFMKIL